MRLVKSSEAHIKQPFDACQVAEYALNFPAMDLAIARINGRYPPQGSVVNEQCAELVYVLAGAGELCVNQQLLSFNTGDVILIEKGEIYYWQGDCKLLMVCQPAWSAAQHKLLK